ncbi:DUF4864 domain-containing protein [Alphaproteobacteria bacterium]|nr:DUF4864 domain-containing protein [Alphaproteobacteria bacterium]
MSSLKFIIILCTILFVHSLSKAENILEQDLFETEIIIKNQLQAFINKDAEEAFSYAAPMIKLRFDNPDNFMTMVKNYYEPVYNPKQYYFINAKYFEGSVYHQLQIVSQSNLSYLATYSLIKDNDEWKISGCSVYPMRQESI